MKCSDAGQCGCLVSRLTIPIWKQVGDMQLLSVSQVLMDVSLFQIDNTPTYIHEIIVQPLGQTEWPPSAWPWREWLSPR